MRPIQDRPQQSQEVVDRVDGGERKSGRKMSSSNLVGSFSQGQRPLVARNGPGLFALEQQSSHWLSQNRKEERGRKWANVAFNSVSLPSWTYWVSAALLNECRATIGYPPRSSSQSCRAVPS